MNLKTVDSAHRSAIINLCLGLTAVTLVAATGTITQAQAPLRCGQAELFQKLSTETMERIEEKNNRALQEYLLAGSRKSAAQYPIPVVFHFLLTQGQDSLMGNDTGLIRRVNSQLQVLNEDFAAANSDLALVPVPFQPLIGNSGIQFTRAVNNSTAYSIAPGIEKRIVPNGTAFNMSTAYADAKRTASGGLDGWNPAQYLNVWCFSTGGFVLGYCIPPQYVGSSLGGTTLTPADQGITLQYSVLGRRENANQYFSPAINAGGRTLTHEMGHYFELLHLWDDNAQSCAAMGGTVDGIPDTPPQKGPSYCTPGCPVFPKFDACTPSGNGIMFMNFMDYVDDDAMYFFTKNQVSRMQFSISPNQPSYSLTQQPQSVRQNTLNTGFGIYPNPSNSGIFEIQNNGSETTGLLQIYNLTGQLLKTLPAVQPGSSASIDLSEAPAGVYFGTIGNRSGIHTFKLIVSK